MKLSGAAIALFGLSIAGLRATAGTPLDPTTRNAEFSPSASVSIPLITPEVSVPQPLAKAVLNPPTQAASPQRLAAQPVQGAAEKRVASPAARRPEASRMSATTPAVRATLVTSDHVLVSPRVAKYQDGLAAARAATLARFPAGSAGTASHINRFVFRRNPPDTGTAVDPAAAVPAGGRSPASP